MAFVLAQALGFVDDAAKVAYSAAIDRLRLEEAALGLEHEPSLVTLGFASLFGRHEQGQVNVCQGTPTLGDGRGYFFNPRLGKDLFDYASVHLYPWSDLDRLSDDPQLDPASEHQNRYHQLRYMLDYIRADRPVVLEETGYNTCNGSTVPTINPDHVEVNDPSDPAGCARRDDVQEEVWTKESETVAEAQGNGALFWIYRDRIDRGHWGAVRLDGTLKPVYDDIPQLLDNLQAGRDLAGDALGCIEVDPYDRPAWDRSLMTFFGDYLAAADAGNGNYGHVDVRVPGEVGGTTCP